ncbi:hypothetical protein F4Z99_09485 [Candidatus Poribacteria bacterium]|nr:hypothetical protein [Candidatus Poribacteria bacterium]MYB01461.1 hypothetical protein [Candidatus Poribacteria bacterium]
MRNINSQDEHSSWAQKTSHCPNYSELNDEQVLLRTAFNPGLIAARKKHGGYDSLPQKEQFRVLRDVADQEWTEKKSRVETNL